MRNPYLIYSIFVLQLAQPLVPYNLATTPHRLAVIVLNITHFHSYRLPLRAFFDVDAIAVT